MLNQINLSLKLSKKEKLKAISAIKKWDKAMTIEKVGLWKHHMNAGYTDTYFLFKKMGLDVSCMTRPMVVPEA